MNYWCEDNHNTCLLLHPLVGRQMLGPLCYKLTWIALLRVNVISRDKNSSIQCQLDGIIYRSKVFSTTKALCNANLEYDHEAQTFKNPEPELEALTAKVLRSMSINGVQIHRATTFRDEGDIGNSCGTFRVIIESSSKVYGIFKSHRRRVINNHLHYRNQCN